MDRTGSPMRKSAGHAAVDPEDGIESYRKPRSVLRRIAEISFTFLFFAVVVVAALPLGARVKVDAWSDRIRLMKSKPVTLLWAREKMPFEVTPLFPHLVRVSGRPQNVREETLPH